MKVFLQRNKLEKRQEIYEQDLLFSCRNKSTKPIFLDNIKGNINLWNLFLIQ